VLCCIGSNGLERQVVKLPTESDDEFEKTMNKLRKNSNSNASKTSASNDNDDDADANDITANADATTATATNGNSKGNGKGKAKKLSKQTSTTAEDQVEAVHETPKQQQAYRPCNHTGHCVPHVHTDDCNPGCNGDVDGCCSCANSDHYCTIYCKCPLNCPKRFRGCNCGSGQCRTKVINILHVYAYYCYYDLFFSTSYLYAELACSIIRYYHPC
jgi:hypothetical protein